MSYVPIHFEPDYANMIVGLWCDQCQLPSVVHVPIVVFSEWGVTTGSNMTACVQCDENIEWEEGQDGGDLVSC